MAQHLLRFGIDGLDTERIIRWDGDTAKNRLTVWLQGASDPLVLNLDGVQGSSLATWLEANSEDGKIVPTPKP